MQSNGTNVINIVLILQNVISASPNLAKIEELAITPAMDTSAAADICLLGITARGVSIAIVYLVKYFLLILK